MSDLMELYKVRIENDDGTKAFYPHTSTDIVFDSEGKSVDELLAAINGSMQPKDNLLINSCFKVWQRGDSITPTSANKYISDRWKVRGTVDGNTTYSLYKSNGCMLIKSTSSQASQIEQVVEFDDLRVQKAINMGITSQLFYDRYGSGDKGATTLVISLYDSSLETLLEKKSAINTDGESQDRKIVVTLSPSEILDYKDSLKYVSFKIVNGSMNANTTIINKWTKMEFGIFPTDYVPPKYADDFKKCEEYYAIRGINIRLDMASSEFYRYTIPCNFMLTKNSTITIIGNTGDIKTSETNVSKTNSVRLINYEFVASSTGNRKQVTITAVFDGEIY